MSDEPGGAHHDPTHRAHGLAAAAADWVTSESVRVLVDAVDPRDPDADLMHLDEELPDWVTAAYASGTVPDGLAEADWARLRDVLDVEQQAAVRFNFRTQAGKKYVERFESGRVRFPRALSEVITQQTTLLGLVDPVLPTRREHDRTLVLGGGFRSPRLRARYAAQLAERGVELGELYFLGSPRPLIVDTRPWWRRWWKPRGERRKTKKYAPGAVDEFDLMTAAATEAFPLASGPTVFVCGCADGAGVCPAWTHGAGREFPDMPVAFTHERARELFAADGTRRGAVLSASTSRPPVRPDTADTYGLWSRYAAPADGARLLVVTTQLFVPFQRFDAWRRLALDHDVDVEAVGYGAEWNDRPLTTENLLQETLSGIRSARRLVVAAADAARSGTGTSDPGRG